MGSERVLKMRDVGSDAPVREGGSLPHGHGAVPWCQAGSEPCALERQSLLHYQDKGKGIPVPRSCTVSILSSLLPSGCQRWPASQDQQDTPCWRSPLL